MNVQRLHSTGSAVVAWNGGVCQVCTARYLGSHQCSADDLIRRAQELLRMAQGCSPGDSADVTTGCPCRPENGGSGVCGCVLGGPKVTC